MPSVILTDERGKPTGTADLLEAHRLPGKLHKAFSVYVFRQSRSEILIQKRGEEKMLWPQIWANTCCSHPRDAETPVQAGQRRLTEELGFSCKLKSSGSFVYRAVDPTGRGVEHEHVTVLVGTVGDDAVITPNPAEVADVQWMSIDTLRKDMKKHPAAYAPWLHLGLPIALK